MPPAEPWIPIHDAPLVAVHAQVVAEAVTTTSAVPPPDANAALAGAIVNVQGTGTGGTVAAAA